MKAKKRHKPNVRLKRLLEKRNPQDLTIKNRRRIMEKMAAMARRIAKLEERMDFVTLVVRKF